jgi:hypothetical protein
VPWWLSACLLLVWVAASARAADTPSNAELFPRGHAHFTRCWQLEHDYYALRGEIAHTGVVWRREQLEVQWQEVRDARRESCLMGW